MAQEMTPQPQSGIGIFPAGFLAQDTEELSAPGNGVWYFFPRNADNVSVILDSTGDGRIEVTTASYADIAADTVDPDAIVPWPHGDIGIAKKEVAIDHGNAFRQVNISGTTKMNATAKS